jgi:two-component system, sensor histidine kinase RegB
MDAVVDRFTSSRAARRWLVRMRWHAVGGAVLAIAIARLGLGLALPLAPLAAVIAAIAASNVALARQLPETPARLGVITALDAGLLTLLLAFSGGPDNPFAILYLLLLTVTAQLAGRRWSLIVLAIAAAGYASLFAWHVAVPELGELHPHSLAVALAIGAGTHTYSISRLTSALRAHHASLEEARQRVTRAETLAAVGTLAVGAAHELGTPLGAIAIAASDLEHLLADGEALDEARGIRDEVDRCRAIVDRMATRAGVTLGEVPAPITASAVFARLAGELDADEAARLETRVEHDDVFRSPVHGLVHVLANLVRNAAHASDDGAAVVITASVDGGRVVFHVDDQGRGIPVDVLPRLGEPFFTTRPGAGMGLGLYLSRTYAELWGGRLAIAPRPERGTRVTLELPRLAEATRG